MSIKKKRVRVILVISIVVGLLWIYMLGKTFHPIFSTKLIVKEKFLSILEAENENRAVHLVKTQNRLIRINYEKVNSFLYKYSTKKTSSFGTGSKDIMINYFSASPDVDCFIYGFCRNSDIKTIVFTFPDATKLEVVPNEEGIFLQRSDFEPLDAEQIIGYTDTGETIDILEYILN